MNFILLGLLLFLACIQTQAAPYKPGNPGAPWTEDQATIIRNKILYLWRTDVSMSNVESFDFKNPNATDTDYIYEPDRRLTDLDCNINEMMCRTSWNKNTRLDAIAFSPEKAIRLAFHDCQPYIDGSGGCDGCINFEDNVAENDVLQHSVGILEKLYLEKDYPTIEGGPTLEASPKDLGISRADLWSFAGLVALDEVSRRSRAFCYNFDEKLTCGDFSPCFSPFPEDFMKLFKTGRSDCIPSLAASEKQGYLAPLSEKSPHAVANGVQTAEYFKTQFGLNPREALALMGAHTVGKYSTFRTHIDYSWVRKRGSMRNKVFNNEYYRTLAAKPGHVKDNFCVGSMDGGLPKVNWHVFANLLEFSWPQTIPGEYWTQRPRRLIWHHEVTRAPNCQVADEDSMNTGMQTPWVNTGKANSEFKPLVLRLEKYAKGKGFNSMYEYCCKIQADGCGTTNGEPCDPECEQAVQNRMRHLSSDVGFYLKFDFDKEGLPTGCKAFDRVQRNRWGWYYANEIPGPAECLKQDMDDGFGQEIWKTVEMYAEDLDLWLADFVSVWAKMGQNGNQNLVNGPKNFLMSRCCIHSSVNYHNTLPTFAYLKVENALDCQTKCQTTPGCQWFSYNITWKGCSLKSALPNSKKVSYSRNDYLGGPPNCPTDENECEAYKTL